jgi:hypothetical protein
MLTNNTILLKTKVVHGLINRLLNLLPVRSPLDEFVHVLGERISTDGFQHCDANYLRPVGSTVARGVSHNLRKILGVLHNKDVTKHLEVGKIGRDVLNLIVAISYHHSGIGDHSVNTFSPTINA